MKIAFIGMGTMGAPMAMNIIKGGHEVTIHNRNRKKEKPVAEAGAVRAASPAEAAAGVDIVITCVSDTPDVREILLGDNGVIKGAKEKTIVVDMSTISPSATREMANELAQKGIRMIDAPVSGGSEGAQNGTLAIMVGGDPDDVEIVQPVLEPWERRSPMWDPSGPASLPRPSIKWSLPPPI